MRQREPADALLLGRGLRGVGAKRPIDRVAERLFVHPTRQVLLRVRRGHDPHIRPLVSLALDIGQAHRAFLLFQIGQQFNDRPRVQPQMIVCGQQAAELPLGQRPAERGLRALADGREAVVVHARAAQLVRRILRRIRRLVRLRHLHRRGELVQSERRAFIPLSG